MALVRWTVIVLVAACGRYGFDAEGSDDDDDGSVDANGGGPIIDAPLGSANYVFATSTTQAAGSLGGLAGADAVCNARAAAAGLAGTYVAWLSDSTTTAITRLGSARGWIRRDGRPFVDTVADLAARKSIYPIRFDETGALIPLPATADVLTNTFVTGSAGSSSCSDFTSTAGGFPDCGSSSAATGSWTWTIDLCSCGDPRRLYCFGVDRNEAVTAPTTTGRKAFLASGFNPGGGLAAADTFCTDAAAAGGLSGSFVAYLASSSGPASSRLTAAGETWVRVDGIPIATTAAAFIAGDMLAPNNVKLTGEHSGELAWTGGCNDMIATGNSTTGTLGQVDETGPQRLASGGSGIGCNNTAAIYCFER